MRRFLILLAFLLAPCPSHAATTTPDLDFRVYYCLVAFSKVREVIANHYNTKIKAEFPDKEDQELSHQFMMVVFGNCFKQMEAFSDLEVYTFIYSMISNHTAPLPVNPLRHDVDLSPVFGNATAFEALKKVDERIQKVQAIPKVP
jgi:hypothetical protein